MNSYYVINLLVYAAVDAMACLGLNQQFGVAGVTNFGFVIFQAAGGYAAAILALPPDTANGGFQSYLGGWNLPFPLPWVGAAVVGGLLALPFTFLVGRRLRGDFAAVGLLVTAVLFNLLATNYRPALNGAAGLSLIPPPLASGAAAAAGFSVEPGGYQWAFTIGAVALCAAVFWFVRRITESPYGRSLRAMRDNDIVADSLGKNLLSLRTAMLVTGGAIAGLSGGVLVSFINTWSPAAWGYAETVVLFAAVIIGGAGNHWGAILGAVLVPVGFVSDHLEVAYDLDIEAAQLAARLGLPLVRAATPGTDPRFVAMITELVSERSHGLPPRALGDLGPALGVCGAGCCGAGVSRPADRQAAR